MALKIPCMITACGIYQIMQHEGGKTIHVYMYKLKLDHVNEPVMKLT